MSKFRHAMLGMLAATVFTGSLAAAALAAPGNQTCYFGVCAQTQADAPVPTAAPTLAPSGEARQLPAHGSWTTLADGETVVVMDKLNDGSVFAIAAYGDGKAGFYMREPKWGMTKGQTFKMTIAIDGMTYAGEAVALDETTLLMDDVTVECLAAVYGGHRAEISIGRFQAELTTLRDGAAAMDDAIAYRKTLAQ